MTFITNASQAAFDQMQSIRPELSNAYRSIMELLKLNPGAASKLRGKNSPEVGTLDYIHIQAAAFAASRNPRAPQAPSTIPDEMVSLILHEYFDLPIEDLNRAKQEHLLSMGAENLVGELLERYLATYLEPRGWIWCSGSVVKAVDFIKPPHSSTDTWTLLQIKNRDNSENSSSSAIRNGTTIKKWFRTYSKKTGTNWAAFPDATICPLVSEEGFKDFVSSYLLSLRAL